jgi:hypothetical protein
MARRNRHQRPPRRIWASWGVFAPAAPFDAISAAPIARRPLEQRNVEVATVLIDRPAAAIIRLVSANTHRAPSELSSFGGASARLARSRSDHEPSPVPGVPSFGGRLGSSPARMISGGIHVNIGALDRRLCARSAERAANWLIHAAVVRPVQSGVLTSS